MSECNKWVCKFENMSLTLNSFSAMLLHGQSCFSCWSTSQKCQHRGSNHASCSQGGITARQFPPVAMSHFKMNLFVIHLKRTFCWIYIKRNDWEKYIDFICKPQAGFNLCRNTLDNTLKNIHTRAHTQDALPWRPWKTLLITVPLASITAAQTWPTNPSLSLSPFSLLPHPPIHTHINIHTPIHLHTNHALHIFLPHLIISIIMYDYTCRPPTKAVGGPNWAH